MGVTGYAVDFCTRCSLITDPPIPRGGGNAFQEKALATVYVQEDTGQLIIVVHRDDCWQLAEDLRKAEARRCP
jgi:hypothetical protein